MAIEEPEWPADGQWPGWWPDGADPEIVFECARTGTCARCQELVEAMHKLNRGRSPDGEHMSISAFE